MANIHAGYLGDVWKHLGLAEILVLEQPAIYWESHAGAAVQHLANDEPSGIGVRRLRAKGGAIPTLARAAYLQLSSPGPDQSLGSAGIAMRLLPNADFLLCELDSKSAENLSADAGKLGRKTKVRCCDGLFELSSMIDRAKTEDVLAFLDPYLIFEPSLRRKTAIDCFVELRTAGIRAVMFFAYNSLSRRSWGFAKLNRAIRLAEGAPVFSWELRLQDEDRDGILGCALVTAGLSAKTCEKLIGLELGMELLYRGTELSMEFEHQYG